MQLTTPALLFPAISLLFLAYTNRFLAIAQLIRQLHNKQTQCKKVNLHKQINNLSLRIDLIRWMQIFAVISFLLCSMTMFFIFIELVVVAKWLFVISVFLLTISLFVSLWEIVISTKAIQMELDEIT